MRHSKGQVWGGVSCRQSVMQVGDRDKERCTTGRAECLPDNHLTPTLLLNQWIVADMFTTVPHKVWTDF